MAVELRTQLGRGAQAGVAADPLEVVVLHTTTRGTLTSLRRAAELADGLAARIRLLVIAEVPYPLDLSSPAVPAAFTKRRFTTIASESRVDTTVDIRWGREKLAMIETALKAKSLVVMDRRRGWWRFAERKLAKRLERLGHQIVYSN